MCTLTYLLRVHCGDTCILVLFFLLKTFIPNYSSANLALNKIKLKNVIKNKWRAKNGVDYIVTIRNGEKTPLTYSVKYFLCLSIYLHFRSFITISKN
jgi:hypothetical protein